MNDSKDLTRRKLGTWATIAGLVILAAGGGYVLRGAFAPADPHGDHVADGASAAPATEWTCSMHPEVRSDSPGKCPKCGMDLVVPVTASQGTGLREFVTSEDARALMNIEVARVERKSVVNDVRMSGRVEYDEARLSHITAWVGGRLDKLYVDVTGVPVRKGDHMVSIYSPELLSTQAELLQALQTVSKLKDGRDGIVLQTAKETVNAAREKLRLLGLAPEQIAELEKSGKATDHVTIYSPASGIVVEKNTKEGMYVQTGTRIYSIADLSKVWAMLDAYESDLQWLRYGQAVTFTTVSYPGEEFSGMISLFDPVLDARTRTVKVRVTVDNADGRLKPGMFVRAKVQSRLVAGGTAMTPSLAGKWTCPMHPEIIEDGPGKCEICGMSLERTESLGYVAADPADEVAPLVIPASAALITGTRAIVYVRVDDSPRYEGRQIVLGPRAGDSYIVLSGLREGEWVVTRGNFSIDSALQIQAKPSMMSLEGRARTGGHQHGGAAPAAGDSTAMKDMPAEPLPEPFAVQLHAVLAAADQVAGAARTDDLPAIHAAYAALGEAVDSADATQLDGHYLMMWRELSMRLTNDAVEGRLAETLDKARRVALALKADVDAVGRHLPIMHDHASMPSGDAPEQMTMPPPTTQPPAAPPPATAPPADQPMWTCSMHPEVLSDKPGQCPKCGMDLIPVTAPGAPGQLQEWTCSMHPEVRSDKPGQCPICNMDLVPMRGRGVSPLLSPSSRGRDARDTSSYSSPETAHE